MKKIILSIIFAATCAMSANAQEQNVERPLLASNENLVSFTPRTDLSPTELETTINKINPYTLYRKGSFAEYKFQQDGKDFAYMGGPTYIQQVVSDEKVENGLLVAYVQQKFFNKKHNPSKGIPEKFKDYSFPTEIDVDGHFHLTHDIANEFYALKSRSGYGIMFPSTFEVGQQLTCSEILDECSNLLGGSIKMTRTFKDFKVEKFEEVTTPAGTFDCVKICGELKMVAKGINYHEYVEYWLARGIGIVRMDAKPILKKGYGKVYTMYLNALDLK